MKTMRTTKRSLATATATVALAAAMALLALGGAAARAADLTWDNGGGTMRWNTSEDNWVGSTPFSAGDNVTFTTTGAGAVYIGTTGPTPVDVAPGTVTVNGNYTFSGGALTSGSLNTGWDCTVKFDSYTSDVFSFPGGVTGITGGLYFRPSGNSGSYSFGTGEITLGSRGGGYTFYFKPQGNNNTLTGNFRSPTGVTPTWANPNLNPLPVGSGTTYTGNRILGNLYLDGNISVDSELAVTSILSGNRTIGLSNGSNLSGGITGAAYIPTFSVAGNNEAWTDWSARVEDNGFTPTWTIAGTTKTGTGNLRMIHTRSLGEALTLTTGALSVGGHAAATDLISNTASLAFKGGKLFLRRNGTGSDTETVGSLSLNAAHNEIFLSTNAGQINTLASTAALTRTNYATGLVSSNNLGGSSNAGRITLPSAPTLIGGGGGPGTTNISIIPFLIGGTSVSDYSSGGMSADKGSTLVTYDSTTNSLRTLSTGEFATSIDGVSGTTTNVRRTSSETLTGNRTVNALVLDGTPTVSLGGNTLTVNSGALLARATTANTITIGNAVGDGYLDMNGGEGVLSVTASDTTYQNGTLRINSVIQNGSLTKGGYGILDLRADNTFTGPFVVNGGSGGDQNSTRAVYLYGTLATTDIRLMGGETRLYGNDRLNTASIPMVDARAGAWLNLNGYTQTFKNLQNGPNGGGTVAGGGSSILTLNPDAGDTTTFTGSLNGLARLVKEGPNVLTLGLSTGPSQLHLEDGILRRTTSFGASQWHFRGGILEGPYSFRDLTYNTNMFFGPGGGGWSARGGNMTIWISGAIAQEWGVSPGFVLNGDPLMFNTIYSDAVVQYDSYINLGSSGTNDREFRVSDNPGSSADYATIAGAVSGAAGNVLWKTGDGLLQLNNLNTFAGGMKISAGKVRVMGDASFGAAPGAATTNVTFDGGTLHFGASFNPNVNRTLLITPSTTGTIDTQAYTPTIAGKITGGGALAKSGTGTLTLSGANDYTGGTTVNAGTLTAGSATALGNGGPLALAAAGATLNVNGNSLTIGALSGVAGSLITNAGTGTATATLTSDFDTTSSTYAGVIQNGTTRLVALAKDGTGTLELTGSNTYTGGTTVNGGTLLVGNANALGTTGAIQVNNDATLAVGNGITLARHSAITFNAGSTLGGHGTYSTSGASWTAPAGLTIAPGMSIGTLTLDLGGSPNTFDLNGASLEIEVADDGSCDLLIVNGNLDLTGTDNALILTGTVLKGYTYTIASTTGGLVDGTFDAINASGLNGTPTIIYNADSIQFFVPEPATAAVLALAVSAALLRRRRPARG